MIIKHEDGRKEVAVIDMEALIPKNHLLRKIDRSVNWMSVAVIKCRKVAVKKCMFMAVRNDI